MKIKKNILVTGGNGQLANELKEIVTANNNLEYLFIFASHSEFDITNKEMCEKYLNDYPIDIIINTAAYTNVEKAETDSETAFLINGESLKNLSELCKERNIVLIHISTDYVFSSNFNQPIIRTSETEPINVYGNSKLLGEQLIAQSGCNYIIIRTSWLYSKQQNNFVRKMADSIYLEKPLKIVYDQIGSPTSAKDLANFIYDIIINNNKKYGIYHFCNKGVASWYDVTMVIKNYFIEKGFINKDYNGISPCLSIEFKSNVKRPSYSVMDTRFTEEKFGFEIPYWIDSLRKVLDEITSDV